MNELFSLSNKLAIRQAYMDVDSVRLRREIGEHYSDPYIDFPLWVLSRQNHWRGDEQVLDISPGDGDYFEIARQRFPDGQYIAVDVAPELLFAARAHPLAGEIKMLVGGLPSLPFADYTFDAILANHRLYYMLDVDAAIAELHRVLKPNGVLLASTSSQYSMAEIDTLTRRALTLLGHPPRDSAQYYGQVVESFSLENGAIKLSRVFRGVARHEVPTTFVFREAQPFIEYLHTNRAIHEPTLPPDVSWDAFMEVMTEQIRRLITHFGELVINQLSGVLLATDQGGFSQDYFAILNGSR